MFRSSLEQHITLPIRKVCNGVFIIDHLWCNTSSTTQKGLSDSGRSDYHITLAFISSHIDRRKTLEDFSCDTGYYLDKNKYKLLSAFLKSYNCFYINAEMLKPIELNRSHKLMPYKSTEEIIDTYIYKRITTMPWYLWVALYFMFFDGKITSLLSNFIPQLRGATSILSVFSNKK